MKSWLIIGVFVVVGVGVGTALALLPAGWSGDDGLLIEESATLPDLPPADGPQPVVEVDNADYDFGMMERNAESTHKFKFTNVGKYPLVLKSGGSTCKCTLSEVDAESVAPGESTNVELKWTAKTDEDRFRQSATILTNDRRRRRITLTVSGRVGHSIQIEPPEIVFSSVTPNETPTASAVIYGFTTDALEVTNHALLNPETAELFDIAIEPIPQEELIADALSGQRLTVTLKPGLPFGPIEQSVEATVNVPNVPPTEIPIRGSVSNGVSVVGGRWNPNLQLIALGTVPRSKGATGTFKLLVRGPHRHDVRFEADKSDPDFIEVEVGEAADVGNAVQIPVTYKIPPHAPAVAFYGENQGGLARIRLNSNQPYIGVVPLRVRFATRD